MAIQLFLDCIDRATTPPTAFVSFREQPMHFKDNQTLSLRVVDPMADEGVWAKKDHGAVWRQNVEAKRKVYLFNLSGFTARQLLSTALERARQVEC